MFAQGAYLTIWGVVDKQNYAEVEVSSNKKNKATGEFECDFSSKFVRFCGRAYQLRPMENQRIKVLNCGVSNCYMKDGKRVYTKNPTYCIFDYELVEGSNGKGGGNGAPYNPYSSANSGNFQDLDLESESVLPF